MILIDELLHYYETKDRKILITTNLQIENADLHVVVIKILSWLRLEHKRTLWIAEGRKTCLKPLDIDMRYPWCVDLSTLVEKEKLFHDTFSIRDRKFDFLDSVAEENRKSAREKVYLQYIPVKHVLYRNNLEALLGGGVNDTVDRMDELKQLFWELFAIVQEYGDSTYDIQKQIIKRILRDMEKDDSEIDIMSQIKCEYRKLFFPKSPLSEFYVWKNDLDERKKINSSLEKIKNGLWELLK